MGLGLSCNYWAATAGCNMWHNRDEIAVREDLALLVQSDMNCLRALPIWSDFQPATPVYGGGGVVYMLDFSPEQHLFDNDPENSPYYHIYRDVFREERESYPVQSNDPTVRVVWHPTSGYCHVLNYSDTEKTVAGCTVSPFDAVLIKEDDI